MDEGHDGPKAAINRETAMRAEDIGVINEGEGVHFHDEEFVDMSINIDDFDGDFGRVICRLANGFVNDAVVADPDLVEDLVAVGGGGELEMEPAGGSGVFWIFILKNLLHCGRMAIGLYDFCCKKIYFFNFKIVFLLF